ncbi:MAG: hypothetical protein IJA83_12315 [Clostridia bacterium]|nr:hypothetical protein [Clostridia bacterium]
MNRQPADIRTAIDTTLSGASHDPTLFHRVVNASKGDDPPMKRKLTVSLALMLILTLLTGTALAAGLNIAGVQDFFNLRHELTLKGMASGFEEAFQINQQAVVRPSKQRHTSEIVDVNVKEVYCTNKAVYVFAIFTPKDESVIIIPTTSDPEQNPQNEQLLRDSLKIKGQQVYTLWAFSNLEMPGIISDSVHVRYGYERRLEDGSVAVMASYPVDEMRFTYAFKGKSTLQTDFVLTNARNQVKEYNTVYFDLSRLEEQDHGDYTY